MVITKLCPACEYTFNSSQSGPEPCPCCSILVGRDNDPVNKPKHYQDALLGHEAIDVVEAMVTKYCNDLDEEDLYCLGNVMKYLLRAPDKGSLSIDLQKAEWYLHRMNGGRRERMERTNEDKD